MCINAPTAARIWDEVRKMREILFRGKRIDNGEWVEGYLVPITINCYDKGYEIIEPDGIEYDELDGYHPLFSSDRVDPATVGQYTGLQDKNGRKIFEGDIVDCWSEGVNAKGTVQQRKDGLWIIYPNWQKTIMWGLCPDEYCHTTVEVIGNIHDNPELLQEVNQP